MLFKIVLNKSKRKPNKKWVDNSSDFNNRSMKLWLEKNYKEIYSTHNEEKSVIAERFTRNLKSKTYKYMTTVYKKCVYG